VESFPPSRTLNLFDMASKRRSRITGMGGAARSNLRPADYPGASRCILMYRCRQYCIDVSTHPVMRPCFRPIISSCRRHAMETIHSGCVGQISDPHLTCSVNRHRKFQNHYICLTTTAEPIASNKFTISTNKSIPQHGQGNSMKRLSLISLQVPPMRRFKSWLVVYYLHLICL
jgi:hypothetical protein